MPQPLTIPGVLQLRLPQVCQAHKDGLADIALLLQRCMPDSAAVAPCLEQLLKHLERSRVRQQLYHSYPSLRPERTGILRGWSLSETEPHPFRQKTVPTLFFSQDCHRLRGTSDAYLYEERPPLTVDSQVPQQALQHGCLQQKWVLSTRQILLPNCPYKGCEELRTVPRRNGMEWNMHTCTPVNGIYV